MRVLTICSDQQMGEHSSHLAQPPRGPACNRDVAVLPAAPDQSGYPQTGAQLLRANAESVQHPSLCDPMLPRGGPCSPQRWALLPTITPTSTHKPPFSHVAGKPAFCRKLEGRAEPVACSVLTDRPIWAGAWPSWAACSVHVGCRVGVRTNRMLEDTVLSPSRRQGLAPHPRQAGWPLPGSPREQSLR